MIPSSVNILGQTYTVSISKLPDGLHGQCDTEKYAITISENQDEVNIKKTLLHEVVHAILHQTGWEYAIDDSKISEEGIVRALEHGLWQAGYRMVD